VLVGWSVEVECDFTWVFCDETNFGAFSEASIGSEDGIWTLERVDAFGALEDGFRGVRRGDLKGL
jgi:hypothetical protein